MATPTSHCIDADKKIADLVREVEALQVEAQTYTAGCGIDITGTVISAAVDGVTVVCEDGVLKSFAAFPYEAGCGIELADGLISVVTDDTTIECVDGILSVISANSIEVEDEGGSLGDFSILNFTGAGVVATDAGGGQANITISGGGGGGGGQLITGTLAADLTADDASVTVNVAEYTGSDPGATVTVYNTDASYGSFNTFFGDNSAPCMAVYMDSESKWRFVWIEPPIYRPT